MPNRISGFHMLRYVLISTILLSVGLSSYAFNPDHYVPSSMLSSGRWAKVMVEETGMQFISDETLQYLGFNNPIDVNVYGYGGAVIPENLDSPDDLPMIPSIRVEGGILFFGKNSIEWNRNLSGSTEYFHFSHPYSDESYYFISDRVSERLVPEKKTGEMVFGDPLTFFTERLVYEQDLSMPIPSGRLMLGDDFRSNSLRSFKFSLPSNIGNVKMTTAFGCKTGSGVSTLVFTANGKQLDATTADRMAASDSKLIITTKTVKEIENPGNELDITIKFNGSGNINIAALDYIELEYQRSIKLEKDQLYFYINPQSVKSVRIENASESTVVWDVTDHLNPFEVNTFFYEGNLTFVSQAGYHEYIAFNPESVKRPVTIVGEITNQDIHSISSPDMLVICPEEYLPAANRLVSLHKQTDGLRVEVLTPEKIYNEFSSGKPDVSAFRKLLKMWYDRAGGIEMEYPQYCLIMSRPTYDNKGVTPQVRNCGYPRVPIWQSPTGETESSSYSTDDYIGMLNDIEDFNIATAEINVAVARMPVKSLREADAMIDKLENYLLNPDYGAWRSRVMVIADDQDKGVHLEQAENIISIMRNETKGKDALYDKIYLDAFTLEYSGTGTTYPGAHEKMMSLWNEGTAFINYIGHANVKSWGHENLLTWSDINSMNNSRLPFIYASTCDFMRWDGDDISGAEALWLLPSSGVIGMICPSREVLITTNGVLNDATSKYFFKTDATRKYLSVGEIMRRGKNESSTGANKLRYGLIGDPSLKLPFPSLDVKLDEINGEELDSFDIVPIINARSTVTMRGHIQEGDNILTDFNGILEINLYDAEKTITTNGNGSDGVESVYNDRPVLLYKGKVKVEDGKWYLSFKMPIEIENNFSPALFSMYAYDEEGREANGTYDRFYVYGYDENTPDDFEGPHLTEFYLNYPGFANGSEVSPNPTLFAAFYDESGINLSQSGLGHDITLELDGKYFIEDIGLYYTPDETSSERGSLKYLLKDIAPGFHSLKLTVWDNANNSTSATLDFSISALWKPSIVNLTTDINPASSNVNFIIETDGTLSNMECSIEVFDLQGRRVWNEKTGHLMTGNLTATLNWDLCDFGGARISPGLYLYRANIKTAKGEIVSKTKKLIVR